MHRLIAYSLALIVLLSAAAAAQEDERPTSLLDGAVTYALPASWVVASHASTPERGSLQASIPYAAAEKLKQRADVSLIAHAVPEKVSVGDESNGVYKNKYEGLAVLSDTSDEGGWRTLVWTAKAGETVYLFLDRFGVAEGRAVELRVALPLIEGGNSKWVEKAVGDFNSACESLKIAGRNKFEYRVEYDKLVKHLPPSRG